MAHRSPMNASLLSNDHQEESDNSFNIDFTERKIPADTEATDPRFVRLELALQEVKSNSSQRLNRDCNGALNAITGDECKAVCAGGCCSGFLFMVLAMWFIDALGDWLRKDTRSDAGFDGVFFGKVLAVFLVPALVCCGGGLGYVLGRAYCRNRTDMADPNQSTGIITEDAKTALLSAADALTVEPSFVAITIAPTSPLALHNDDDNSAARPELKISVDNFQHQSSHLLRLFKSLKPTDAGYHRETTLDFLKKALDSCKEDLAGIRALLNLIVEYTMNLTSDSSNRIVGPGIGSA